MREKRKEKKEINAFNRRPSPPRTLGNCLRLPLSSAIIMIIIVSRGLIELARAK